MWARRPVLGKKQAITQSLGLINEQLEPVFNDAMATHGN